MEDLQTGTLSDYRKHQTEQLDASKDAENDCAAFQNGCDELDPLDLMDHCENQSFGTNSDVWKGSDSEDEAFNNARSMEVEEQNTRNNENNKENKHHSREEPSADNTTANEKEEEGTKTEVANAVNTIENEDNPIKLADKDESVNNETVTGVENELEQPEQHQEQATTESPQVGKEESNSKDNPITVCESQTDDKTNTECMVSSETIETEAVVAPEDIASNADNKNPSKSTEEQEDEVPMDFDEDEDFDPSLLCPEVSMAVDENPVITTTAESVLNEDNDAGDAEPVQQPLSTFVDEMTGAEVTFNLTSEEQELRKRIYGIRNPVQQTRIHCTACNVHLGSALEGQSNRFVHPMLKVLICKECYHFYTSGEFEKDEDGSELYCRWCGQGGRVLCCSKCEFVFCKRCIRTNFGRKKMTEIRDSDSWDCFRCNQSQIITQRIACYEFFEYIRFEMSRVATVDSPEIWSKDYSKCCFLKKRQLDDGEEVKRAKRKKDVDPDFTPESCENDNSDLLQNKPFIMSKQIQFVPKLVSTDNDIEFVQQIPAPTAAKPPKPLFRPIAPALSKIFRLTPQQVAPLMPTTHFVGTSVSKMKSAVSSAIMKHEWFEKTVRAAARVNSHLSYTLTQLNKAQSQAVSVEELAVVHNKLQEILSSSVNSLIQIRKNLRSEFITGIKTVRMPSKKTEIDDDVILVNPPALMPLPSTSQIKVKTVSVVAGGIGGHAAPRTGYLKVKSVKDLQSVPWECITIPDEAPEPPALAPISYGVGVRNLDERIDLTDDTPVVSTANSTHTNSPKIGVLDAPQTGILDSLLRDAQNKSEKAKCDVNNENARVDRDVSNGNLDLNVKKESNSKIQNMFSAYVRVKREDLEDLQKRLMH